MYNHQSASLFLEDMFAMFVPFTLEEIVVALNCRGMQLVDGVVEVNGMRIWPYNRRRVVSFLKSVLRKLMIR